MSRYAAQTQVSSEKSRAEIERILMRYGATGFMYGWEDRQATIVFRAHGKMVRFNLPIPDPDDYAETETGRSRTMDSALKAYEQAVKQRWRALALAIKAKLETVESEISSFEDEFLAHIMLPNGQTVGEWSGPQIDAAYEDAKMPPLLPAGSGSED